VPAFSQQISRPISRFVFQPDRRKRITKEAYGLSATGFFRFILGGAPNYGQGSTGEATQHWDPAIWALGGDSQKVSARIHFTESRQTLRAILTFNFSNS